MGIQAGTSNAENQYLKEATEMNTKTNTNSFFNISIEQSIKGGSEMITKKNSSIFSNKIAYGFIGLLILTLIVFLARLSVHSWLSQLMR